MRVTDFNILLPFVAGMLVAILFVWLFFRRWLKLSRQGLAKEMELARQKADVSAAQVIANAEHKAAQILQNAEKEASRKQLEVEMLQREFYRSEATLQQQQETLAKEQAELKERSKSLDSERDKLEVLTRDYLKRIEDVSKLSCEQVKQSLLEEVSRECEDEIRDYRSQMICKGESEVQAEARKILIATMQRISTYPQHDTNATIVQLPGEDMKGRIIGREGRNIKSFESTTGTTLLIDETPDSVLISCFDPVRREIAKVALEYLIRDGRIHPASIEEAVERATGEVKSSVTGFGSEALRRVRLNHVHPEIVALLGKLRYRLSNNQNSLDHSIEVANLCALLAAELRLEIEPAKRAGLFHDIGKSLEDEYEGSHAVAGANVLKRLGESTVVVNAVAAHHEEIPEESPYAALVKIADTISAVRPGARAESIDSYIQRVRNLEELACSMDGVQEAYAIQAGREIRVIVKPDELDDTGTRQMARALRRKIEDELQYPGTIKITVIRECRVVEQAR
ncbi:MAG: ribonuclease Y [Opitutales bacterium]|nr:ribonuclease Y [Opitutales bacterium]